jgi:hypothetical protein
MLNVDEEDLFFGSPRSKFYDVLLNARRSVVESMMDEFLDRYAAMESILSQNENFKFEDIDSFILNEPDKLYEKRQDLYIDLSTKVLTKHE